MRIGFAWIVFLVLPGLSGVSGDATDWSNPDRRDWGIGIQSDPVSKPGHRDSHRQKPCPDGS